MTPRRFLLLGSGEFEDWTDGAEAAALAEATGDGSVVILPTASSTEGDAVFDRWGRMGLDHYARSGVPAKVLPVKTAADAAREDLAARAGAASMIYFSGGKPTHLAEVLHGSPLLEAILGAMDRGAVWAGCSAGAMVVGASRAGGTAGKRWRYGLGLVPHVGFGVHWDKVRRMPGAAWWMSSRLPDDAWFVGIDERTAILGDGGSWQVMGLGSVTVRYRGHSSTIAPGGGFGTGVFKGY